MNWRKCGLIYAPSGEKWWARSHCLLPTVHPIGGGALRVYFAALDDRKYGRVGFVDLDIEDPMRILVVAPRPVLDIGELGAFDDCGVVPSSVLQVGDALYMYYVGFQKAERVPYLLFTGLAIGRLDGSAFKRYWRIPVLDRTHAEPFSRGAAYVMLDGEIFRMWYWSCIHWTESERGPHYNTVIRYATSSDGISWNAADHICLAPEGEDEFALGRPCVLREGAFYKMWFSARSHRELYKIGYAESDDGIHWLRKDTEGGMLKSDSGWDSEMVCYPAVFSHRGQKYMLYNGNHHGATGFGYAVLQA